VLTEAAVRNYVLLLRGIDSTRDFSDRQALQMNSDDK
jgi:serine kinase of HPr protein (carbohydrate metabolism regulator)